MIALTLLLLADLAALTGRLESEKPLERYAAILKLGQLGDKRAAPALIRALGDELAWIRIEAARALVRVGIDRAGIKALSRRLPRAEAEVGVLLAQALGDLGRPAVPALLDLIEKDEGHGAAYALMALARAGRGAAEAVPDLLDLLKHQKPEVRTLAVEALKQCGPWATDEVVGLLDRLKYGDPKTKWIVIRLLGRLGPAAKAALPALRRLAEQGDARLKPAAAEALARIDVKPKPQAKRHPALTDPARAKLRAPDRFVVRFDTTKGKVEVEVKREWSPHGADRLYNLVKIGYFRDIVFFRVVEGFVAQFGLHGDREVSRAWAEQKIEDDEVKVSNRAGWLTFAMAGKNTRTTQLFFNLGDNDLLDGQGFAPVGRVIKGWEAVKALYSGYREEPSQQHIHYEGNKYLRREFPKLDSIRSATILPEKKKK